MNDILFWGIIGVLIIACLFFVFMPDVLFKNPFLGTWQADFDFNPDEVNKKQVEKIKLVFEKDRSLDYLMSFNTISFNRDSESTSRGSIYGTSNLKMHYKKRGDLLVVSMQARSNYLPFVAPFQMESAARSEKLAVVEYSARFSFSDGKLTLEEPQSGRKFCFALAPYSCHNAMAVAGEDGALAGYDPRKNLRRERVSEQSVPN
ncbi:MAG: hypothetical protein NT033_04540 [Candidatus Omnitrophica bacterium]|nr:hypothetical protein [Candidatus Omnitrophota bacterium]